MAVPQATEIQRFEHYLNRIKHYSHPTEELLRLFDATPIWEIRLACLEGMRSVELEESDVVWAENRIKDFHCGHLEFGLAEKILEWYLHRAQFSSNPRFLFRALSLAANTGSSSSAFRLPALRAISEAVYISGTVEGFRFQVDPGALESLLRMALTGVMDRSNCGREGYEEKDWQIAEWALKIAKTLKPDYILGLVNILIKQHENGESVPKNTHWFNREKNLAVLQAVRHALEAAKADK